MQGDVLRRDIVHTSDSHLALCHRCAKIPIFNLTWPLNASHSLQLLHNEPRVIHTITQGETDWMRYSERQCSGNGATSVAFYGKFTGLSRITLAGFHFMCHLKPATSVKYCFCKGNLHSLNHWLRTFLQCAS